MATSAEILQFLIPTGGWVTTGDDWEGVQFIEAAPITKEEFDLGGTKYAAWKSEQDKLAADKKAALLAKLGITEDEAKLLLG